MARPATGYTARINQVLIRPETDEALDRLSETTGLARTHIARVALEKYLTELGLLDPKDLVPTLTITNNRKKENN